MQKNYLFRVMAIVMIFLFSGNWGFGQVSITGTSGTLYSQDFNSLTQATTASTWSNNTTLSGWNLFTKDGNAITSYVGGSGTSNAGSFYSFGIASASDRAIGGAASGGAYFGSPATGAVAGWIAAAFTNNSGATISDLKVNFNGEQWRNGGNASLASQTMVLEYGFGATFGAVASWTAPGGNFDWTSILNTATAAAVNGNSDGLVANKGGDLIGLNWADGSTLWIRWVERNDTGNDHGLAIDDFSISIPGPTLSIADATIAEGNSGTSILTFTAKLSKSAPAGGVTFDIATADLPPVGAVALAGVDYVAKSLSSQTIPEGATEYEFKVTINGDPDSEPDEAFEVLISNISSNATISDGQAIGIILNDDAPYPAITINDVTITEGNIGTSNAMFTVSLSVPALAGGVTFDIATANGTASAGTDFVGKTLTSQTIPAGSNTYTFTVLVNGDTGFEPTETFLVNISNVIGATIGDGQALGTITNDDIAPPTLISAIQGSGMTAALTGTRTVQGVVTRTFFGTGSLNGFYVQEEDADSDGNSATSEGIFVFSPPSQPAVGDIVSVTGTVIDFETTSSGITSSLTEFSPTTSVTVVSTGNPLPTATSITFPVANVADLEKYEGMLVNVTAATGNLVVTDNFNLGRYGQITLAADDPATNQPGTDARIDQYTQFNSPSVSGNTAYLAAVVKRTIIVDDANGSQNIDPILFGRGGNQLSASNTLRTGDAVTNVLAVLDHRFEGYRLQIKNSNELNILPTNPRPALPNLTGSPTLVVGNMNMLNYFNGDGLGGGFPTPRGANTALEFTRQRDKSIQAIINSGADIMSLNEMENDGFGPQSAIQDLINGLNAIAGAGPYAFVIPPMGTIISADEITCAMIYKPAKVMPVGDLKALTTGEFAAASAGGVGRGALAQTFKQTSDGATFTLVGNHFKSKGSLTTTGTGNPDTGDGQGNNNGQRTRQAEQLIAWLATKPTGTLDPDYMIVGDLNSYAKETPLSTLETALYSTLIPNTNTSYQFDGAHGALDHALGNPTLQSQVVSAKKWNINADEPVAIDYNIQLDNGTIIKTAAQIDGLYYADQFRNSDHDPVLVGLNLLCDKPTASIISDPISGTACEGTTIILTGSGGTQFSWNGATYTSTPSFDVTTTRTVKLKVKDAVGCESAEVEKIVTIMPKPAEIVTNATICSGLTYTWAINSVDYNTTTTVTIVNDGCTADQKLVLIVTPKPAEIVTNATICPGQTYTWPVNSVDYNTTTTVTILNDGCTANQKLILTVIPKPVEMTTVQTICSGTTYTWAIDGNVYSTNTTVTIVNDGCTANQKLVLTVTPKPSEIVTTETICSGTTYTWAVDGNEYSTNTTVTIINDGCNADQKLVLTFTPVSYASITTTSQNTLGGITSFIDGNCKLIATVKPIGTSPASGFFQAHVWLRNEPLPNPYVARHYEIGPVGSDGQSGQATVTLYFTQPEFDAFNLATVSTTTTDDLPTGPADTEGIGRLRIMKYPGSGNDEGSPESYDGSPETITPTSVTYADGMWKIVFDVESFSGFFVNGQTVALPVTLVSFTGKKQNNANLLEWKTTNEKAFDGFEIQRSEDGKGFEKIGFVKGGSKENYQFSDNNLSTNINFYRLKMIDIDGSSALSKIIAIQSENETNTLVGKVYPNPAIGKTAFVEITTNKAETWKLTTFNAQGSLQTTSEIQLSKGLNKVSVEFNNLSQGIYFLNLENANGEKFVRKILKN